MQTTQPLEYQSALDRRPPTSQFRWFICALLFLATTINYMDRQVLSLLAPELQKVIGWDERQYGLIVFTFQGAYAIGLATFGWVIDRWGTKAGYSVAIFIWSIAACLHSAARSVVGFAAARFILGIGESGNFPAAIKTTADWFPRRERALATGIFNSGSTLGQVFAPLVVPLIAVRWGWQAAFIVLGLAGFLWLVLWLAVYRRPEESGLVSARELSHIRGDADEAPQTSEKVPWAQLLRFRQTWAFCFCSMLTSPVWWFYLYWLPKFFTRQYHLDLTNLGWPLGIVYILSTVGSICGGWIPALFLRSGWSVNAARKTSLGICAVLTVPAMAATSRHNPWAAVWLLGLAAAGMQGWAANAYTIVSDLFPKKAVGSVTGLGAACGSLAGMGYALLIGEILERTGSYAIPFAISGLSFPMALLAIHLLAPRWIPANLDDAPAAGFPPVMGA